MAFLDGNQTERLCEPMKQYIEARGGQVLLNKPLASLLTFLRPDENTLSNVYVNLCPL